MVVLNWKRVMATVRTRPDAVIREGIRHVLRAEPKLQPLIKASGGELNAIEMIFNVLKDSLREMNADKGYYLDKLRSHNEMADELSDYLASLVDASQDLAGQEGRDDPYECEPTQTVSWVSTLPIKAVTIPTLDRDRRPHSLTARHRPRRRR
jgi:hypothetical protein